MPRNVCSGETADTPYNQPAPSSTSEFNDEAAIVRNFLIDAGVLSVDEEAMFLVDMRAYVRGQWVRWDKQNCSANVDDRDFRQSNVFLSCNKDLSYYIVLCIRRRAAKIVSYGHTS